MESIVFIRTSHVQCNLYYFVVLTRRYKRFSLSIKFTLYLQIKMLDFHIISRIESTIIADPLALKGIVFLTISPNVSLAYFLLKHLLHRRRLKCNVFVKAMDHLPFMGGNLFNVW